MIKILLDTNILHQEGLNSTRFQILQRLIKSNYVDLIIPEIVIEEYMTKRIEQANDDLKKIQSVIDNLHRKSIIDKDCYTVSHLSSYVTNSINQTKPIVELWLDENQVTVLPISQTSIDDLFKHYFEGTGAFRNKKQREDIPDAVIYDCIEKLSKSDKLSVVAKDGALIRSISKMDNVQVYNELSDIIEIPELKEKLAGLNTSEMKVNSIIETLSTFDCRYNIAEYLTENHLVEVVGYYNDEGDFIVLPFDLSENEVTNYEIQVSELEEINLSSPTYLGNRKFSYTLEAECIARMAFHCENDVYEALSFEYRKNFSKTKFEDQNDIIAEGDIKVIFEGVLVLSGIDINTDSSQLEVHLSYLGAERSHIECEINLEKLQVEALY
jgi:hypothetical protein